MSDVFTERTQLVPKNQWICDHCGDLIESIDRGWLEWYHEVGTYDNHTETGFRIVHDHQRCMYNQRSMFAQGKSVSDMHLVDFTGDNGLVSLLSLIETKRIKDIEEFSEIIRRIHVSYYEEARQYWTQAEEDGFFDGANEVWPYLPETSLQIISRYSR
ncbi:hypothetical protein OXB_2815 [Bacillus sp. OxB-1]|uniref:hypothetical protein n=1 Tax=Bacillus sp. (strain OxB-1) TaxID=98228 RepID=UPI0005822422|nr:hypothetical protein [Bacillus sp. OxB-1]BAQ11286.1 hypothetical protein OXB_2815 [Bacillus sp. OxB-1]